MGDKEGLVARGMVERSRDSMHGYVECHYTRTSELGLASMCVLRYIRMGLTSYFTPTIG